MVTPEAKSPKVRQIALSAALCYRLDVVGIPKAPTAVMHAKAATQLGSFPYRQLLKPAIKLDGVQAADRADASIANLYMVAQVSRVGSQPPLVNAGITAESPTPLRHFHTAPPADSSAVRPPLLGPMDPTSWLLSLRAH